MSFDPTSPFNGSASDGLFTSPTYSFVDDTPPNSSSEQIAITSIGGTQTGVTTHSVSDPFTITVERPKNLKVLGTPNPVTGVVSSVPRNTYVLRTRKGVTPLAGQPKQTMLIETRISVPAGADSDDVPNVTAALCAHIGVVNANASGIIAIGKNGIL